VTKLPLQARLALMSIRPRFAELIISGEKTVELRRRNVALKPADQVLVYASSPVMAICGSFVVAAVVRKPLTDLWREFNARSCVTRAEFDEYFDGLGEGTAIEVSSAKSTTPQIPLDELRKVWPGFHPPQTLMYLSEPPVALRRRM
jgi:predicted transcriptional regulator